MCLEPRCVQDWPTNFIFSFIVSSSANFLLFQAEGQTILHIASLNGDENMIRTLYLARANATIQDNEGKIQLTDNDISCRQRVPPQDI